MSEDAEKDWPILMPMVVGILGILLLVGGIGAWSVKARLSGAIVSSGRLSVESNRQIIQHQDGGVVSTILVRDGDNVEAGEVLIRLNDQLKRTELAVVESQLFETLARIARFSGERDGLYYFDPSDELKYQASIDPTMQALLDGQRSLYVSRVKSLQEQLDLLATDTAQVDNQMDGIKFQLWALSEQLTLVEDELANVQILFDKGLVKTTRRSALVKERVQVAGEIGRLNAEMARLVREKTASRIRGVALRTAREQEAITELRDLELREIELVEKRASILQTLEAMEIKSPVDGIIYGTTVFALNSVIRAAEPIMFVVPNGRTLIIDTKIATIDVDQVFVGQRTSLHFSGFDARETPELLGRVVQISADAIAEEMTGSFYYGTRISIEQSEIDRLEGRTLIPGMPVEVFIKTSDKSPLEYLTKPFADFFIRAFRED